MYFCRNDPVLYLVILRFIGPVHCSGSFSSQEVDNFGGQTTVYTKHRVDGTWTRERAALLTSNLSTHISTDGTPEDTATSRREIGVVRETSVTGRQLSTTDFQGDLVTWRKLSEPLPDPLRYSVTPNWKLEQVQSVNETTVLRITTAECRDNKTYNLTSIKGEVHLTDFNDFTNITSDPRQCVVFVTVPDGYFIDLKAVNDYSHRELLVEDPLPDGSFYPTFSYAIYASPRTHRSETNRFRVTVRLRNDFSGPGKPRLGFTYDSKSDPARLELPITFTSRTAGYVTSPAFDGETGFPKLRQYGFLFRDLHIPKGHVAMISFPQFTLDEEKFQCGTLYTTVLYLYEIDNDTQQHALLFKKCAAADIHTRVYNKSLRLKFQVGTNLGNAGFKMLFSFHPEHEAPTLLADGLFNCSVPHYARFKQHLHCNLEPECQGGQDERHCPFALHPGCNGSFGYQDVCFKHITWHESLSWNEANFQCYKAGGHLASLTTREKLNSFRKLFVYGKRRGSVYVGGTTVEDYALPLIYRNMWQWRDRTMAFGLNLSLDLFHKQEILFRMCLVYHPTFSSTVFFPESCDKKSYTSFVCEVGVNNSSVRYKQKTPVAKPASASSTFGPWSPVVTTQLIGAQYGTKWTKGKGNWHVCPHHHVIHDFLSCDPASQCGVDVYVTTCSVAGKGEMATFECENKKETLPFTLVCDFRPDCADGSDEHFCRHPTCSQRTCSNGQCVTWDQWCDKVWNCADGSDELDCVISSLYFQGMDFLPHRTTGMYVLTPPPPAIVSMKSGGGYTVHPISGSKGTCPVTHFHCLSGYCLPVYLRCNGVYDCPGHEDEAGCQQYTCPGFYRCRASGVCVHADHVCDGVFHCPQQDDEWMCTRNLTCPQGCQCQGLALVCTKPFAAQTYPDMRYLDANGSGMTTRDLQFNWYLVHLVLSRNDISVVSNLSLPNLLTLELSENNFKTINTQWFLGLENLRVLSLANNPLVGFSRSNSSVSQNSLLVLNMSHTLVEEVSSEMFSIFPALQTLDLSHCRIVTVGVAGFRFSPSLTVLDLSGNPVHDFPADMFHGVSHLKSVRADNYRLCCRTTLPDYLEPRLCIAPHDTVSSCEDLLRSDLHRVWLWLVTIMTAMGNTGCICIRRRLQDDLLDTGYGLLVTNLNVANGLMAAPLAVLVAADLVFRNCYLQNERAWKASVGCASTGGLSVLSTLVSTFTLFLLSLDRFLLLLSSTHNYRSGRRSVAKGLCVAWFLGIILTVALVMQMDTQRLTSLCLLMPVSTTVTNHSVVIVNTLNLALHLLVALLQLVIQWRARGDIVMTNKTSQDRILARRLTPPVMADSVCWFSVGLLTLLHVAVVPQAVSIPSEVSVGMAVFVLPLSSALNPFLYTFAMLRERQRVARERRMLKWLQGRTISKLRS